MALFRKAADGWRVARIASYSSGTAEWFHSCLRSLSQCDITLHVAGGHFHRAHLPFRKLLCLNLPVSTREVLATPRFVRILSAQVIAFSLWSIFLHPAWCRSILSPYSRNFPNNHANLTVEVDTISEPSIRRNPNHTRDIPTVQYSIPASRKPRQSYSKPQAMCWPRRPWRYFVTLRTVPQKRLRTPRTLQDNFTLCPALRALFGFRRGYRRQSTCTTF